MEDGTKTKKTVFVGGIGDDVDESVLYETFATFGIFLASFIFVYLTNRKPSRGYNRSPTAFGCDESESADWSGESIPAQGAMIHLFFRGQTSGFRLCDIWLIRRCSRCH